MTSYTTAKTYLTYYFNGELDSIIERLRRRKEEKFDDDYYCTLNSIQMRPAMSANSSGTADVTAYRAVALADMKLSREKFYNNYSGLKEDINKHLKQYDQEELILLRAELGLTEANKTEIIKTSSYYQFKANKRIKEILKAFDLIIRRRVEDECD